jgi:hypothetical protein
VKSIRRALLALVVATGVAGCDDFSFAFGFGPCGGYLQVGIVVAFDVTADEPIIGEGLASARSATHTDTVRIAFTGEETTPTISFGADNAGPYSLTIELEGYEPWQRDGIGVGDGRQCAVRPVRVAAHLAPL